MNYKNKFKFSRTNAALSHSILFLAASKEFLSSPKTYKILYNTPKNTKSYIMGTSIKVRLNAWPIKEYIIFLTNFSKGSLFPYKYLNVHGSYHFYPIPFQTILNENASNFQNLMTQMFWIQNNSWESIKNSMKYWCKSDFFISFTLSSLHKELY